MQTTPEARPRRGPIRIPIWLGLCFFLAIALFPGIDPLSHDAGHLWHTLLGSKGNPHLNPIHMASGPVIAAGFILLSRAWRMRREEREVRVGVGPAWDEYAARTPAFLPHLWRRDRLREPVRGG